MWLPLRGRGSPRFALRQPDIRGEPGDRGAQARDGLVRRPRRFDGSRLRAGSRTHATEEESWPLKSRSTFEFLKSEIRKTYASVSEEPDKEFIFPTGRAWAEDLGYPEELANVPETAVGSFAGVGNPWQLGKLTPGERVLDLGSGAGTDSLVAAQMVGEQGHVTGIDMSNRARRSRRARSFEGSTPPGAVGLAEEESPQSLSQRS